MTDEREYKEDKLYFKDKEEVWDYLLKKENYSFAFNLDGAITIFGIKEEEELDSMNYETDYDSLEEILWH